MCQKDYAFRSGGAHPKRGLRIRSRSKLGKILCRFPRFDHKWGRKSCPSCERRLKPRRCVNLERFGKLGIGASKRGNGGFCGRIGLSKCVDALEPDHSHGDLERAKRQFRVSSVWISNPRRTGIDRRIAVTRFLSTGWSMVAWMTSLLPSSFTRSRRASSAILRRI